MPPTEQRWIDLVEYIDLTAKLAVLENSSDAMALLACISEDVEGMRERRLELRERLGVPSE